MPDSLQITSDTVWILILALLFVGFVIYLWLATRHAKKQAAEDEVLRRETAEALGEDPDADPDDSWTPPEPEAFPARVVDMRVVTGNVGGNQRPKTGVSFLVTFLTDDGKRIEYPVPEELYVTLDVDQTGTLVILNGGFFDFGSGDEYDAAAVQDFEETFGPTDDSDTE